MPEPLEIDCQSVKRKLDGAENFVLLDCREVDEYETARIGASVLVPMSEMQQRRAELDAHQGKPIVVLCHHGVRSLRVAKWLRVQGFPDAQSMAGGIEQWSIEIDPAVPRY